MSNDTEQMLQVLDQLAGQMAQDADHLAHDHHVVGRVGGRIQKGIVRVEVDLSRGPLTIRFGYGERVSATVPGASPEPQVLEEEAPPVTPDWFRVVHSRPVRRSPPNPDEPYELAEELVATPPLPTAKRPVVAPPCHRKGAMKRLLLILIPLLLSAPALADDHEMFEVKRVWSSSYQFTKVLLTVPRKATVKCVLYDTDGEPVRAEVKLVTPPVDEMLVSTGAFTGKIERAECYLMK